MSRANRKEAAGRFNLGRARYELGVDKNGNPWTFEFGRALPPYGNPDREHMMKVPERAQITTVKTYHGIGCGSCVHFDFCAKHKSARVDTKYCLMPTRGYTRLGASCPIEGYAGKR